MSSIDWTILIFVLLFIVFYGYYKTRQTKNIKGYITGNPKNSWWTIGLSVMATQASAITFLSTPGQAYNDGMGFIQFYFGLPLAMVVVCMVFIPIYHKLKVFTAYEYVEKRFGIQTGILTAILFLIQRGLAAGITIFAPSIILSIVLGYPLHWVCIVIGVLVIIYTVSGGTQAVNITQKHQMYVILLGMVITFLILISSLPTSLSFTDAMNLAGNYNKLEIVNFSFNLESRYTFWSGITGGFFLALSYFGTDQSQVQRYLSSKDVSQSQLGLLFNGFLKIPMQFFILLIGVLVFVFFLFERPPIHFNSMVENTLMSSSYKDEYLSLKKEHDSLTALRKHKLLKQKTNLTTIETHLEDIKQQTIVLAKTVNPKLETNDKDYVFIYFILNFLPVGLIGLLIAVIISAAMSSTASELNALGTVTSMDLYFRNKRNQVPDKKLLDVSRFFTFLWGIIAILFATLGQLAENLIQFVNIVGSIFYGNVLGIFIMGFFMKFIKGKAVFISAIITQCVVITIFIIYHESLGYLWLNLIGCFFVILLSYIFQKLIPHKK